jgi:hypothetical protein
MGSYRFAPQSMESDVLGRGEWEATRIGYERATPLASVNGDAEAARE